MLTAPLPIDETLRLTTLACLRILDTPPEERFDRITRVVATHFRVPIAAVNLVAATHQWTKAHVGMPALTLPRDVSFCAHAILNDDLLLVPDMLADERFCDNPFVIDTPHVRFYAGVPLRSAEGQALGTLCIADYVPRTLTSEEVEHLRDFALWAERELTTVQLSESLVLQQRAEEALRASEERHRLVINSLREGVVLQDHDGRIEAANASAESILGLSADQLAGRTSLDPRWQALRADGSPFPGEEHPAMVALRTNTAQHNVLMGVHKPDGSLSWILINAQPLSLPAGTEPYGVVTSFTDITELKRYEQELRAAHDQLEARNAHLSVLAATDGLTGIANKRAFAEHLDHVLQSAQREGEPISLILLDVDHFKAYNDAYGHPAGDEALRLVAGVLKESARSSDVVARYGGEEFALLLPQTTLRGAHALAERCRQLLQSERWPHRPITISVGVATLMGGTATAAELVQAADRALYRAKAQGRNRVVRAE